MFQIRAAGREVASAETLADARAAATAVVRDGYPVVEVLDVEGDVIVEVAEMNEWGDVVHLGGEAWEEVA